MLAIAVAISSVNWPRRDSVSNGNGSSPVVPVIMAPQSRPSTMMGVPTAQRRPIGRMASAIGPLALA